MSTSIATGGTLNSNTAAGGLNDVCALSPVQQEIFSDPNHDSYVEQALWKCNGFLGEETLKQCWGILAQRHPILRTVFRRARKQPVQIIRGFLPLSLNICDLTTKSEQEQKEELREVIQKELSRPFDLAEGPLFRVSALRLSLSDFQMLLTFHPILLDRQSAEMICSQASWIYRALEHGEAPPEEDAPGIKEFLLWLKRKDAFEGSEYWQKQLDGAQPTLFPPDEPTPANSGNQRLEIVFDDNLRRSVNELTKQCEVTTLTVLQTAWALLLSRWSGTNDVIYGLSVDGRPKALESAQRIAARFARVLPLRVRLQTGQSLADLLRSIARQTTQLSDCGHLAVPGSSEKLFNTVFTSAPPEREQDFQFRREETLPGIDGPTLQVAFGEDFQVALVYPQARFEAGTIQALATAFLQLMQNMTIDPDGLATETEILSYSERGRVLGFAHDAILSDEKLIRQFNGIEPASCEGIYVVDHQYRLLPIACFGQIAISTTAAPDSGGETEAGVRNPFVQNPTSRLRLVGQRGRWMHDGQLNIVAKAQNQVTGEANGASNGYVEPRTEIEKTVAAVWQEVLGVSRVGLHDDFFDLGGQSLNTIQIRSRLSQRLGINVSLKLIFSNQVLEAQAKAIAALKPAATQAGQGIPRLAMRKHYPVSHAQRRLWFLHRLDPDDRFYHTADYISLEGALNRPAFDSAFHSLVERHEILRTSFKLMADEPVQCIGEPTLTMQFKDLSAMGQEEQSKEMKRLEEEVPKWISNLEQPPVGAFLVKLAEDKHIFVLAIHHILSDEWSGQVVWRDLMEFYSAACRNAAPQLPPIRVRYADFAAWQKDRIESGKLGESERYWLGRLSGPLPKLKLAPERPPNRQPKDDLLMEVVESGPELAAHLVRIGQAEDATPFMVKLAVFKAFLARVTGQADILLGSTTAGRDHPDIEPLVGLFVNVVALRTNLGSDSNFPEILKRVKQTCVEAYAHQEYPFDLLVQRLAPARDGRLLPMLEAFFADVPNLEAKVIEGVRFTAVDVSKGMAAGIAGRKLPVGMGLVCQETGGGNLAWRLLFRPDSFGPETARRLSRQFDAFLTSLARNPQAPLSQIDIASAEKNISLKHLEGPEEYPLSFNQRDMWFQRQIHSEPGLNNLGAIVRLSGPLNVELFRQALQMVIDRHDTLRTFFVERNGIPYQKVRSTVPVTLPVVDLSAKEEAEQAALVQERQYEVIGAPYDFGSAPLFRTELLRLNDKNHVVIFAFNHLILDGVYMAEFFEQAATAYEMLLDGKPASLPQLELQYPDFAAWQDERLAQGVLEQHQSYWQEQLRSPLPPMSLPSDSDTRSVHSFELRFTQWRVRDDVFQRLKTFRKRYRTTMFRTVLAAFEVLLRKIIGEKELLLGIPFTSLPAHVSQLLGFFGHAVPVRIHLDDHQPFTTVLNDVNRAISRAQENLEYPLCEAVRGLQINRDPHRPLFPVVVSQVRDLDRRAGDLHFRMDLRHVHAGVYHLWLTVLESKEGMYLGFYYNREVLEGQPLEMIRECFNELLARIAADPEAPIANLEIVSTAEQEKVLQQLAGEFTSPATDGGGLVARIEDQALTRPQTTAASCGTAALTYEQLNENANRLAHWLRSQGIGRESRIGIFGSRSLEMLTTLLAVLKAGAAVVPLDPEHPNARLRGILEKAEISIVATSADLVARSRELAEGMESLPKVICWHKLSDDLVVPNPAAWADQPVSNPPLVSRLDDLAYVCHTSGSTGLPKGAMIEHRGMLNHLLAKISFLGLNNESIVAQNASHCFDISIWQFFAALLVGGRVVIYPPESLFHQGSMLQLIDRDEITILETVPSLLEMMLNEVPAEVKLARLRYLISNAELLPIPLCQRLKTRFPHLLLVNTYGATECSDDTTHQIVSVANEKTLRIPVGRSIPGAQHYVLDEEFRILPAGCPGQIAIAGDVVGRGYLADAVGTARTFIPNPFRAGGRRLYLTGDLGRWNSVGELEFLGRTDNQVKLFGHRVELGEIEAALGKLAGVRQTAVIVSEEGQGQRLLAYWVGEAEVDTGKLRDHAQKELPAYMVPNAFIQMTSLPLTANGKVDRPALPKPADIQSADFVPPRDEVEFKLAKLWRAELDVAAVGVFDNFFERGGHSLKAVSLVNRLQTEFNISLPLRTLFDHQTIDSLSRVIRNRCQDSSQGQTIKGLVTLQPGKRDSASLPLFLVHPHGGTVFCYQALASALGDRMPIFGIQCCGLEEGEEPLASIPEMASKYVKDIFAAQSQGPYQIAGWSLGGPVAFEVARQLEAGGHEVAFLGVFDSAIPSSTGKKLEQLVSDFPGLESLASEKSMASFGRWFFRADERQFENLNDSQIVGALREMAQRAGMLPPDASPAMLKRFMAVAVMSGLALFQYQPAGPVKTDVVLFRAGQSLVDDPHWWAPWTRGQVQTVPVAGTHYDMVFPPAVRVLAEALRKYLRLAPEPRG